MIRSLLRQRAARLVGLALLAVTAGGCATFWDDVTSRNFSLSAWFTRENPLVVLRDSDDGNKRARALGVLEEPLANGGTQEQQELHVKILTTTALSDREPYCRLAAIRTLGRFKDPRAAETLRAVFLQPLPYSAELNSRIQQQALASLAETRHDKARDLLIRVAKELPVEGSLQDEQETLDRRLTAIRGLGNFPEPDATATLLFLLKTDKDVAVRDRSHEALKKATGKNLPADAAQWEQALYPRATNQPSGVANAGYSRSLGDWLMMKNVWPK